MTPFAVQSACSARAVAAFNRVTHVGSALALTSMLAFSAACAQSSSGTASTSAAPKVFSDKGLDKDTKKLMDRLATLSADSMEGRLAGSPGGAKARNWIEQQLRAIDAKPIGESYEQPVRIPRRTGADSMGANIIARIPGKRGSADLPVIVLSAHYDHLGIRNGEVYNGADDDASGCISILTIAEHLKKSPLQHDVVLVFFDAEEAGLVGARTFVANPSVPLDRIAIDVNLDMVSRQDGGALWVSGTSHYPFLRPVADAPAAKSAVTIRFGHDTKSLKPDDDWTGSSDHGAFHSKGIPFLYLGVEDHADYHKPGDEVQKIDPKFYRGVTDFADALMQAIDAAVATFPARTAK